MDSIETEEVKSYFKKWPKRIVYMWEKGHSQSTTQQMKANKLSESKKDTHTELI